MSGRRDALFCFSFFKKTSFSFVSFLLPVFVPSYGFLPSIFSFRQVCTLLTHSKILGGGEEIFGLYFKRIFFGFWSLGHREVPSLYHTRSVCRPTGSPMFVSNPPLSSRVCFLSRVCAIHPPLDPFLANAGRRLFSRTYVEAGVEERERKKERESPLWRRSLLRLPVREEEEGLGGTRRR